MVALKLLRDCVCYLLFLSSYFLVQVFYRLKIFWTLGASPHLRIVVYNNNNKVPNYTKVWIKRSPFKTFLKHSLAGLRFTGDHHQSSHVNGDILTTFPLKGRHKQDLYASTTAPLGTQQGTYFVSLLTASLGYFMDQFSHLKCLIPRHKLILDAPFIHLVC